MKWLDKWKDKLRKEGYLDGYAAGREYGRDEGASLCIWRIKQERKDAFNQGRNFEFKTINAHLEALYSIKLGANVQYAIELFRRVQIPDLKEFDIQPDSVITQEVEILRQITGDGQDTIQKKM